MFNFLAALSPCTRDLVRLPRPLWSRAHRTFPVAGAIVLRSSNFIKYC